MATVLYGFHGFRRVLGNRKALGTSELAGSFFYGSLSITPSSILFTIPLRLYIWGKLGTLGKMGFKSARTKGVTVFLRAGTIENRGCPHQALPSNRSYFESLRQKPPARTDIRLP